VVAKGRVDHKQEGETKLLALELAAFEAVSERRDVTIKIDALKAPAGIVRELADLVRRFPGEAPVLLAIDGSDGKRLLRLGPDYRVRLDSDFFAEVKHLLGEAAVL
jgi:hypothetical protein